MVYVAKEKLWATILWSHQCFLIYVLFRIQIPFFSFLVSDQWYHNHHRWDDEMRWDETCTWPSFWLTLLMLLHQSCGNQHLVFQQSSEKGLLHMKHEQMIGNRHEIWTPTLASAGNKFLGFMAFFLLAIWTPFPGMSLFLIWQSRRGHWLLESPCHFC